MQIVKTFSQKEQKVYSENEIFPHVDPWLIIKGHHHHPINVNII